MFGCYYFLAITNDASVNIGIYVVCVNIVFCFLFAFWQVGVAGTYFKIEFLSHVA